MDPNRDSQQRFLSPRDVVERLAMSRAWLWGEWAAGRGPAWIRLGNRRRISEASLKAYIRGLEQAKRDGTYMKIEPQAAATGETLQQISTAVCAWCASPFTRRASGGLLQRFCAAPRHCRHRYRQALIDWAEQQLSRGRITIAELRAALARKPSTTTAGEPP